MRSLRHFRPRSTTGCAHRVRPRRKRQGLVPDFSVPCFETNGGFADNLMDIKTIHVGVSTYNASERRCNAVIRRAEAVNAEYLRKTRGLDERWFLMPPDDDGPSTRKLRSFGIVQGLDCGAFGEASVDTHALVAALAAAYSSRSWAHNGFRTPDDAKAAAAQALNSSWSKIGRAHV